MGQAKAWFLGMILSETDGLYTIDLQVIPAQRVVVPIGDLRVVDPLVGVTGHSFKRQQYSIPEDSVAAAAGGIRLWMAQYGQMEYVRYDPPTKSVIVMLRFWPSHFALSQFFRTEDTGKKCQRR